GQVITAERDALTPLATGEWYASDLEGMHVVSVDGATLGIVGKLSNTPSVDVLEIVGEDGAELMVPMVGDAIASIDAVARTVTVDTRFLGLGESRDLG
ncbi:MAG: PRC-barrel domain-containing protein, partial [Solirubrobacterales bacterium]